MRIRSLINGGLFTQARPSAQVCVPPPQHARRTGQKGVLVMSLDFELYWGVRDIRELSACREKLTAARSAIPRLLDLFVKYGIHATWATVGFLFCASRDEVLQTIPSRKPQYARVGMSPYAEIERLGSGEQNDPWHYARSLIHVISSAPHQELGTHTFSHFYCLEDGSDIDSFRADLQAAVMAAERLNLKVESLVFPRNQVNPGYLDACAQMGIQTYRGNNHGWMYAPRKRERESLFRRAIRLMDCYVNLSGHNTYNLFEMASEKPMNVPSSRYLRMPSSLLAPLEPFRLERIRSEMAYAARYGRMYHLWLHPEDLGTDVDKNLHFLRKTLDHFANARDRGEMESLNMREVFHRIANHDGREHQPSF
jgi:peptidoglycan/xylan/chitin deacetylase (PgdA/CDA1 family)